MRVCADFRLSPDDTIDCSLSGSTAVMCASIGNKLYFANTGDSRAMLFRRDPLDASATKLVPVPVTRDHKPDLPSETKRILLAGGNIAPITYEDGTDGPQRVWTREGDVPGLAMSRSVGDVVGKSAGVTSQPELHEVTLQADDCFVLLGSDGLWEFLATDIIADALAKCMLSPMDGHPDDNVRATLALETLRDLAVVAWQANEGVTDDISIVLGCVGPIEDDDGGGEGE